jgi:hypothetical protein
MIDALLTSTPRREFSGLERGAAGQSLLAVVVVRCVWISSALRLVSTSQGPCPPGTS